LINSPLLCHQADNFTRLIGHLRREYYPTLSTENYDQCITVAKRRYLLFDYVCVKPGRGFVMRQKDWCEFYYVVRWSEYILAMCSGTEMVDGVRQAPLVSIVIWMN
jgi:hypothetical protein